MARYYECSCTHAGLRIEVFESPPKWDDDEIYIWWVVRPMRWSLWTRLKKAWQIFWKGDLNLDEICLKRRAGRAMAEYILRRLDEVEGGEEKKHFTAEDTEGTE